ncbi:MAG: hypothetical protein FD167_3563 [bacterium]|nr:MAG: hypothetical protein FD167_3563 [bacterium]
MALTSRKKRPLNRTIPYLRDTKLIIIATEGSCTEKQYFEIFKNLKLQIKIIATPKEDTKSAPKYVLERLNSFKQTYQLNKEDELWLMIDVDRWTPESLSQVCSECYQKGYLLAISNPCFEMWLYLHFLDLDTTVTNITCNDIENNLRSHLGSYNKSNLDIESYKLHIPDAIKRARDLDSNPNERWPSLLGTRVYKIVEKFIN